MSSHRGRQRKPKGGIPPELMNVEFNPNESVDDDAVEMNAGNGDHHVYNFNYGLQQRSYTYKDRPGSLRGDGYGGGGKGRYNPVTNPATLAIQSHNYEPDESEVWRAYVAQVHFSNRGQWWTTGKKRSLKRWILTFAVGVVQALVATVCNFASRSMATKKFDYVYELMNPSLETYEEKIAGADDDLATAEAAMDDGGMFGTSSLAADAAGGNIWKAFLNFVLIQTALCLAASIFVYIGKCRISL